MSRVTAFVEDSPEARPVIAMAQALGDVFSAEVEAIHVGEESPALSRLAREAGVGFRLLSGDPTDRITEEMVSGDVTAGVLGTRRRTRGPRPAGHIALRVIAHVSRPMAVVPPQAVVPLPGELRRILVPLDGTDESAQAVRGVCEAFARSNVEIVVLHIFDRHTVPGFWDQPHYAAEAWGEAFRARFLESTEARIELRTGTPQDEIMTVSAEEDVDAIALGWSQRLDPGRARVVRRVLSDAPLPILLFPTRTI